MKKIMALGLAALLSAAATIGCGMSAPTAPAGPTITPVIPTATPPSGDTGLANPASVYCEEQGGTLEIRTAADGGQVGICIFADGSECEEWAFFRGECAPGGEEPTVEIVPDVVFHGASFSYDDSLASDVIAEIVPAEEFMNGDIIPEHIRFSFVGYILPDTFHEPVIHIYPVSDFEPGSMLAQNAADLQALLAGGIVPPAEGSFTTSNLPFLPLFNAGQMLHTQTAILNFQNGQGVRFLTQYTQSYVPVNNHEMFYTFQGLTDDGAYYVAAILPASHPTLPPDESSIPGGDFEAFADNFDNYLNDTALQLNAQDGASFTPSLMLLDEMIQSLEVTPPGG